MTINNIKKLIDYCIKMPEKEEYEKGHKYPYYSCELLCSMNGLNLEKILKMPDESIENKDCTEKNNNDNDKKIDDDKNNDKANNKIDKDKDEKEKENKDNKTDNEEDEEDIEYDKRIIDEADDSDEECQISFRSENARTKIEPNHKLVNSILDYFFSFLKEKSSVDNYVLMGYFNKITNYLIKTKTKIILDYILVTRKNLIKDLLLHINRYAIANIIVNILTALSEDNTPDANEKYLLIVNQLIEQLQLDENNSDTIEIICDLFINSIIYNNKIKLSKVIDINIITKFETVTRNFFEKSSNNKNKIFYVIELLTKMNNSIISNFSKKITSTKNPDDNKNEMLKLIKIADKSNNQYTSLNNTRFDFKDLVNRAFINNYINYCNSISSICLLVINDLIQENKNENENEKNLNINEEIGCSFSTKKIKKCGLYDINLINYINSVLDIYINMLGILSENEEKKKFIIEKIKLIIDTNVFKIIIDYYFIYKNNNFVTNLMLDLTSIIFDSDQAPEDLIINFLQLNNNTSKDKDNFITLLINNLIKETKFKYENSDNTMNNLLFGSNVEILKKIFICKNPYMAKIYEEMKKEKFFYDNFVINVDKIFSKKLYKSETEKDKPISDSFGVRVGTTNLYQGNSDIPFSLESLNDIIVFNLKVNEKYVAGEDYMPLFKERDQKLVEIKYSSEYIRLGNQDKDYDSETEEEEEEYDEVDIPKQTFYNSKMDEKKKEEQNKEKNEDKENTENKEEKENKENKENKDNKENKEDKENDKKEDNKENKENKENNNNVNEQNTNINKKDENNDENNIYNDVNFWHTEIKGENYDDLIKELL